MISKQRALGTFLSRRFAVLGAAWLALSTVACESASVDPDPDRDLRVSVDTFNPGHLGVSLTATVDVPVAGTYLTTDEFWGEVAANDPLFGRRCPTANDALLTEVGDRLGGVRWGHTVRQLIDEGQPKLYDSKFADEQPEWPPYADSNRGGEAGGDVTIERPDLVGYRDGYAVFLSNTHGLLVVDVRGDAPKVSCALQLPGEPLNFFARGNAFVINVNGAGEAYHNGSALLHFRFNADAFELVDAPFFAHERIVDARSFTDNISQALAVYTQVFEAREELIETPPDSCPESGCPEPETRSYWQPTGAVRLNVLDWTESLGAAFTDEFQNDDIGALEATVVDQGEPLVAGQHVYSYQSFHDFLSASDRYLVIPQRGTDRFVDHIVNYTRQRCTSYNPQWYQQTRCYPDYERRPNPDYVPPAPSGDYDCNGLSLAACIQQAAPRVSQYIYVRVGQTCNQYWVGRCEAYETYSGSYPVYRDEKKTRYLVYRFANGAFSRLDDTLFDLDPTAGEGASRLSFSPVPFELTGHITRPDHIQFQNGYLYVLSSGELHTFRLEGNSAVRTARLEPMGAWVDDWYAEQALIRYSGDRAMIAKRSSSWNWTDIISLSLAQPYRPVVNNSFTMPGNDTQILASQFGYLAPGQVDIPMGGDYVRSLQKLTLHSREDAAELDNLILGTEFNSLGQTYLGGDDQALRLDGASQRLFAPFLGYHHVTSVPSFLLSISQIAEGDIVSMGTLEMSEAIVRTVGITADLALAFGDSSVHRLSLGREGEPGLWQSETVEEIFVTTHAYRFDDQDRHARIDRFSQKCRITTVENRAALFAQADGIAANSFEVYCVGEPHAIGSSIVFAQSETGVTWDASGENLRALSADEVRGRLALTDLDFYCTTHPEIVAPFFPQQLMAATGEELAGVACFFYPLWALDGSWGWYW
jgi:hypothetical protein